MCNILNLLVLQSHRVEPSFALCCLSARFPNVRQPAWVTVFICSSSSFRTGLLEAESSPSPSCRPDAVGVVGPGFGSMPDIIRKASNVVTATELGCKTGSSQSPYSVCCCFGFWQNTVFTSVAVKRPTDTLSPSAKAWWYVFNWKSTTDALSGERFWIMQKNLQIVFTKFTNVTPKWPA